MKKTKPGPMEVEQIKVTELIPQARNARTHSDAQVAQIAASVREFGFTNPVLIDAEGTIIAGHGRVMAARKLSLESVPCLRLGHLTPEQVRAYVIADNKLALNAGWDEEMLKSELDALLKDGFDVGLTGFDDEEISKLLNTGDNEDKDEVQITSAFEVIAECENEDQQQMVYNMLMEKGVKCRLVTL